MYDPKTRTCPLVHLFPLALYLNTSMLGEKYDDQLAIIHASRKRNSKKKTKKSCRNPNSESVTKQG